MLGTRWVSKDRRDRGKVVLVQDDWGGRVVVETVEHPTRQDLVGRTHVLKPSTLREKYRELKASDDTHVRAPDPVTA